MTKQEKEETKFNDITDEMEQDLQENFDEEELDENNSHIDETEDDEDLVIESKVNLNDELALLKETLARQQADFNNFKKRVDRDRDDMIFFLKLDILKKILPRIDDMQRIISQTPENQKNGAIYEGIISIEKKLTQDLEKMGVKSFVSKGDTVNPDKHEVMTQVPGDEGIIIEEFEKGYLLGDRVLRVAKVVVGLGL